MSNIDNAKDTTDRTTSAKIEAPVDVESTVSTTLTPLSSPLSCPFTPNVDIEPLSPLSSPATCVTSLPDVPVASVSPVSEGPALEERVMSRRTSPIPGPSKARLVSAELELSKGPEIAGPSSRPAEEVVKCAAAKDSKRKRPRKSSPEASSQRSRSSSPSARPRKKRSKPSTEDVAECHADGNESTNMVAALGTCQANHTARASPAPRAQDPIGDIMQDIDDSDSSYALARKEMNGFLIQAMALSRASSMPASTLLKVVLRENAHLIEQRSKDSWLEIVRDVLRSHDVFGRIDRDGLVSKSKNVSV